MCVKPNMFVSLRCEGDVSRSDSDCAETGNQSGDPILRDEPAAQLVQRWDSLFTAKTIQCSCPVSVLWVTDAFSLFISSTLHAM